MTGDNPKHSPPLRGAIIGFGNVAIHAHLPLWLKSNHFRIDAVVEPLPERARVAMDVLPEARIYSGIEPLVAENDLDFVDICTPPCFHADLMLESCRSGLHVFCEKPLVTSLESLHKIQEAADEFQRVIFTVNNWKHAPLWSKAVELIRENRIGTVRSILLTVLRPSNSGGGATNWRKCAEIAGGGILLDHGWHHFYLILSVINESPLSISARMEYSQVNGPGLEETVDVVLRFRDAEARLQLTWRASYRQNYGTITGEQGTIVINDNHLILYADGLPPTRYDFAEALSGGSHHLDWMKPVIEDFHREILEVDARGANFMECKYCAQLTYLAYKSHREGSCFIPVHNPIL
ncbi:MAG: Gfo/Idh/MocA family oxidoreductase [Deltaproteobacteria bacterium]|nr:Gfo/Idh/MocA family oxidoreductase [Deltaproteobacteria bacterium]